MRAFLFASLLGLFATSASAEFATAEAILAKMASRYATAQSYQDSGTVLIYHPELTTPCEMRFRTHFIRPERFSLEWSMPLIPQLRQPIAFFVIWTNQTGSYYYDDQAFEFEKRPSLNSLLGGAAGVSQALTNHIPRLLITSTDLTPISAYLPAKLLGQADVEGTPCFQLRLRRFDGRPCDAWIGTEDYLLHQFELLTEGPVRVVEIHRHMQINAPIPDAIFNFEPPVPLKAPVIPVTP